MRYLAAALLAAALSGCSLVEDVIVIERPGAKTAAVAKAAASKPVKRTASAAAPAKCPSGDCKQVSKASSARYDSGPVLKPLRKTSKDEPPPGDVEDSAFVSAVKSFLRAGLHLPGWADKQ